MNEMAPAPTSQPESSPVTNAVMLQDGAEDAIGATVR